jgi:hypothetical protein
MLSFSGPERPSRKRTKSDENKMAAQEKHVYSVETTKGNVDLTTKSHHSALASIEDFIKAHQATISTVTGVGSIVTAVYLHGRKLK